MENLEIIKRQDFLIYQDDNGVSRVNVRFEGDDVWLTAEQLTELFDASQQNISHHINQIYAEGELDENRTHKKYLLVRNEGKRSVKRRKLHKLSCHSCAALKNRNFSHLTLVFSIFFYFCNFLFQLIQHKIDQYENNH